MRKEPSTGRHSSGSSFPFISVGKMTVSQVKTHQPTGTSRLTEPANSGIGFSESTNVHGISLAQETETGLKLETLSCSMSSFVILRMPCSSATPCVESPVIYE